MYAKFGWDIFSFSRNMAHSCFRVVGTLNAGWLHVDACYRGFAKRTLMKTARKAGLKPKEASGKRKYIMPTPPMSRRSFSLQQEPLRDRPASICCEEELSSESCDMGRVSCFSVSIKISIFASLKTHFFLAVLAA